MKHLGVAGEKNQLRVVDAGEVARRVNYQIEDRDEILAGRV